MSTTTWPLTFTCMAGARRSTSRHASLARALKTPSSGLAREGSSCGKGFSYSRLDLHLLREGCDDASASCLFLYSRRLLSSVPLEPLLCLRARLERTSRRPFEGSGTLKYRAGPNPCNNNEHREKMSQQNQSGTFSRLGSGGLDIWRERDGVGWERRHKAVICLRVDGPFANVFKMLVTGMNIS